MQNGEHIQPRRTAQARLFQVLLIFSTLALSWLGMMVVHELGLIMIELITYAG